MGGVSQAWAEAGQQAEERRQQRNAIQEQQRVQQQNTVGAQLLDAINQSSNIKPTMKDEQGNVVDNPAYAQAQIDRRNLLAQYTALNSPEQHASFGQRLHGLIFGHPTDQKREPALSPAGAETPQPPAAASLMAPNAAPPAPQHPMAAPNPETEALLAKGQGFMDKLKNHMAAFAHPLPAQPKPDVATIAKYYRDPSEVQFQRNLEMWGLRGQTAEDVARIRSNYALLNTPEKMRLDSGARALGYDGFMNTPPDIQDSLLKQYKSATTLPTWKATEEGNDIYAVDAHDPSKRQLIGHKDDTTQHLVYKTMTMPDGTEYEVPFVEWTKKGSSTPPITTQASPADVKRLAGQTAAPSPASSATPAIPSTTPAGVSGTSSPEPITSVVPPALAQTNAQIATANATSKKLNKGKPSPASAKTPLPPGVPKGAIPFGAKESPEAKADQAAYTKALEDSQQKQAAFQNAQGLLDDKNRKTDLELIYAWVRSNVQGAGRMTNAEIQQAATAGSWGTRIQNYFSIASTGRLSPEIEQEFMTEIKRANDTAQSQVATLKTQLQQDLNPSSRNAPAAPGAWKPPADAPAPTKVGQVLKVDGNVIARSADGKTWSQP